MKIDITQLKTGFMVTDQDDEAHAYSSLPELIEALPGFFFTETSEREQVFTDISAAAFALATEIAPQQVGVPLEGEIPVSELNSIQPNGSADADQA